MSVTAGRGASPAATPLPVTIVVTLAIGIAIRLWQYLLVRPLWNDEAMLAVSVASRRPAELLHPSPWDQIAPPGFLWLEWLTGRLFGFGELGLRAVPLLAGCVALVVMVVLARRAAGNSVALATALLGAVNPAMVYFSVEAKPYAMDLLLGASVLLARYGYVESGRSRRHRWYLVMLGAIGVWFSVGVVFVLAALSVLEFVVARRNAAQAWRMGLTLAVPWALSFAAAYFVMYSRAAESAYMQAYWLGAYARPTLDGLDAIGRLLWGTFAGPPLFRETFVGQPAIAKAAVVCVGLTIVTLAAAGTFRIASTSGMVPALLLPIGFVVASTAAGAYPLATRLVLMLLTSLLLLVAAGLVRISERFRRGTTVAVVAVCLPLVVLAVPRDGRWKLASIHWADVRSVIAQVDRDTAPVYVIARAAPIWAYYSQLQRPGEVSLTTLEAINGAAAPGFADRDGPTGKALSLSQRVISHSTGRTVALGMGTGMAWRYTSGFSRRVPYAHWTDQELEIIRALASPRVWVFAAHDLERSEPRLHAALLADGHRVIRRIAASKATATQYLIRRAP